MPAWASAMRPAPSAEAHSALPLALPTVIPAASAAAVDDWQVVRLQPGHTRSAIFSARALGMAELQEVMDAAGSAKSALHHIRPGQGLDLLIGSDGSHHGFRCDQ